MAYVHRKDWSLNFLPVVPESFLGDLKVMDAIYFVLSWEK